MNKYISTCLMLSGLMALPAQADWLETFDGANPDNPFMVNGFAIGGGSPEGSVSLVTNGGEGFLEATAPPAGSNGNPNQAPNGAAIITALNVTESFTDVTVRGLVNAADEINGMPQRVDHSLLARSSQLGSYALFLDVEAMLNRLSLVKIMPDQTVDVLNTVDLQPPAGPVFDGEAPYFLEFTLIGDMLTGRLLAAVGNNPGAQIAELSATDDMFASGFSGFSANADSSAAGLTSPLRAGFDNVSSATVPAPAGALLLLTGLLFGRFRKK